MPCPFSDRRHRGMRKTVRDRYQIIAAGQKMSSLEREIVHGAEHAPISRAGETDRMHGGKLKVNPLLRNIEPLEETAQ